MLIELEDKFERAESSLLQLGAHALGVRAVALVHPIHLRGQLDAHGAKRATETNRATSFARRTDGKLCEKSNVFRELLLPRGVTCR